MESSHTGPRDTGAEGSGGLQLPTLNELIQLVESWHPDADPVLRIAAAVELSTTLTDLTDHLVGHFVDAARAAGASWAQIGVGLGVSKQAVQQRFVPREPATVADFVPEGPRFSRFTVRAKHTVGESETVARATGSVAVGPLHLLLGQFVEPDGLAVRALVALGADPEAVRAAAVGALPEPDPEAGSEDGSLPFTAEGRKVIDLAAREALNLGHNYVGTEHVLLALLVDPHSEAARVLGSFGLTHDGVRDEIVRFLADYLEKSKRGRTR